MPNHSGQVNETEEEIQLSEEQEEWVKDYLHELPVNLEITQKQYITEHWNRVIDLEAYQALFPPDELTTEEIETDRLLVQVLERLSSEESEFDRHIVRVGDIPQREWLIDGIIPKKTINFIAGDKGIGKTLLTLQMAACLMDGKPFLGRKTEHSRVLFVERDEPMEGINEKVMRQKYNNLQDLEMYTGELQVDRSSGKLEGLIRYKKPDVLFLDSFRMLHRGNENDSTDMGKVMDCLRKATEELGITVVCIHHLTRPQRGQERHLRGSTVIETTADFILGLFKEPNNIINLKGMKAMSDYSDIKLTLDRETLTFEPKGWETKKNNMEQRKARVRELLDSGTALKEIKRQVVQEYRCDPRTVGRDLEELQR